jgi:hypothetical protein
MPQWWENATVFRLLRIVALIAAVFATGASGQTVSIKDGNVFFTAKDGSTIQITSSGLDSDPSLSLNHKLVVFVRRTPSLKIETGLGLPADKNELWIAETSRTEPPRRVLVGHAGGFKADENLVLAGFGSPQFSPDASRIYFGAETWAMQYSFRMLDLRSERVRFLYAGLGLEVLQTGKYAGYLIALKTIPSVIVARIFRYWLLDPEGKDVGEIGGDESHDWVVEVFKRERN